MDLCQHRRHAQAVANPWAFRSTGRASSRPATRNIPPPANAVLDFLDAGLVTRKTSKVNWDPVDQTVLANEQVIDGRGWRSGALVEQRELTQWFFKISDFAEELLAGLDTLEDWPEKVRLMQRNWIGRSEGLRILFEVTSGGAIEVFTTRPDTLFGASFVALSPDHPLATGLAATDPALANFIAECHRMGTAAETIETAEKKGYRTPLEVARPVIGQDASVYVANFVLMVHRRHFGCPPTTSATSISPTLRPPVLPVVCRGEDPIFSVNRGLTGPGTAFAPGSSTGSISTRPGKDRPTLEAREVGNRKQATRQVNYRLRTGAFRASAIGLPDPGHPQTAASCRCQSDLPVRLPEDVEFDTPATLDRHENVQARPAQMQRTGGARPTPWTRSLIPVVFRAFTARAPGADHSRHGRQMVAGRPVYRGSSTPSCTSSIRAFSRAPCRKPGICRSPSRSGAFSPKAW